MCAHTDATSNSAHNGINGLGVGVTSIDAQECRVVDGFDAIFDNEEGATVQFFQIVKQSVRHAVGTGTDDDADDIGHGKRLFVFGFEMVERGVGVGVGLEVSQVFHIGIFPGKKALPLFELLGDGFLCDTIVRIECLVVAIGAATCAHPTIAIGAGEASVEGDFLRLHT